MTSNGESLLSPYRVLDLTDEKGYLCGKILADLGADVIKVEPPEGDPGRKLGPFYHDIPDPEKSLYWFAFNMNKRGITLDIETADGKQLFERLVKTADLVIESFPPGYMAQLGLDYSPLSKINPRIILTSISPFGQEGPYRDYLTSDIVSVAMGGIMYISGDTDRPPVRNSSPQAYPNAGAEAAVASMIALYHRSVTGEGQLVDVSIQQSIVSSATIGPAWWQIQKLLIHRAGPNRADSVVSDTYRISWPCKDGNLSFTIRGGPGGIASDQALFEWMDSEGMADDFIKDIDWSTFDIANLDDDWMRRVNEQMLRFFMSHTRQELLEEAVKRKIILLPTASPKDILQSEQLEARDFWVKVPHPELATELTYPGPFIHSSKTPWKLRCRAPLIGEHNLEVYGEIGVSVEDLVTLKQAGII